MKQVIRSAGRPDPRLVADLVSANRILALHEVLDGWGHVSVRHNLDPGRYLLSRSLAPSLPRLVSRAIFLALNATLQMQAMLMTRDVGKIVFLDAEEARLIEEREGYGLGRAWEAWKRNALAKNKVEGIRFA